MDYYAEIWLGEPIEECKSIVRSIDGGEFERYNVATDKWEKYTGFAGIFIGEVDAVKITEEEAMRIINYQLDVRKKEITEIKEKLKNTGYDVDKLNDDELVELWRKVNG